MEKREVTTREKKSAQKEKIALADSFDELELDENIALLYSAATIDIFSFLLWVCKAQKVVQKMLKRRRRHMTTARKSHYSHTWCNSLYFSVSQLR